MNKASPLGSTTTAPKQDLARIGRMSRMGLHIQASPPRGGGGTPLLITAWPPVDDDLWPYGERMLTRSISDSVVLSRVRVPPELESFGSASSADTSVILFGGDSALDKTAGMQVSTNDAVFEDTKYDHGKPETTTCMMMSAIPRLPAHPFQLDPHATVVLVLPPLLPSSSLFVKERDMVFDVLRAILRTCESATVDTEMGSGGNKLNGVAYSIKKGYAESVNFTVRLFHCVEAGTLPLEFHRCCGDAFTFWPLVREAMHKLKDQLEAAQFTVVMSTWAAVAHKKEETEKHVSSATCGTGQGQDQEQEHLCMQNLPRGTSLMCEEEEPAACDKDDEKAVFMMSWSDPAARRAELVPLLDMVRCEFDDVRQEGCKMAASLANIVAASVEAVRAVVVIGLVSALAEVVEDTRSSARYAASLALSLLASEHPEALWTHNEEETENNALGLALLRGAFNDVSRGARTGRRYLNMQMERTCLRALRSLMANNKWKLRIHELFAAHFSTLLEMNLRAGSAYSTDTCLNVCLNEFLKVMRE